MAEEKKKKSRSLKLPKTEKRKDTGKKSSGSITKGETIHNKNTRKRSERIEAIFGK